MLWLDNRLYICKKPLKEEDDFVIMDVELEKEFDAFKTEIIKEDALFIPENDLLYHWYATENDRFDAVTKFGRRYFKLTQEEVDAFFVWMKAKKEFMLSRM